MSDLREDEKKFAPKEKPDKLKEEINQCTCGGKLVAGIVWDEKREAEKVYYCWKCKKYADISKKV